MLVGMLKSPNYDEVVTEVGKMKLEFVEEIKKLRMIVIGKAGLC